MERRKERDLLYSFRSPLRAGRARDLREAYGDRLGPNLFSWLRYFSVCIASGPCPVAGLHTRRDRLSSPSDLKHFFRYCSKSSEREV